jgi:hypothetical protein
VGQSLATFDAALAMVFAEDHGKARSVDQKVHPAPIDLDRSRKVGFGGTARKPAPMLMPDRLTVKMTVKICGTPSRALRINSLEGSLMIEWE